MIPKIESAKIQCTFAEIFYKIILFKNRFNYWCINILKHFYCTFPGKYHFSVYGNKFHIIEMKLFISINSIHDTFNLNHNIYYGFSISKEKLFELSKQPIVRLYPSVVSKQVQEK